MLTSRLEPTKSSRTTAPSGGVNYVVVAPYENPNEGISYHSPGRPGQSVYQPTISIYVANSASFDISEYLTVLYVTQTCHKIFEQYQNRYSTAVVCICSTCLTVTKRKKKRVKIRCPHQDSNRQKARVFSGAVRPHPTKTPIAGVFLSWWHLHRSVIAPPLRYLRANA